MRIPDGWITLEEAAPIVGVSSRTMRKYATQGRFPTVDKVRHARIVPRADLALVMTIADGADLERSVLVEATNVLDRLTDEPASFYVGSMGDELAALGAAYGRFRKARRAILESRKAA